MFSVRPVSKNIFTPHVKLKDFRKMVKESDYLIKGPG